MKRDDHICEKECILSFDFTDAQMVLEDFFYVATNSMPIDDDRAAFFFIRLIVLNLNFKKIKRGTP